jgi:hypothetical protein
MDVMEKTINEGPHSACNVMAAKVCKVFNMKPDTGSNKNDLSSWYSVVGNV